MSTTLTPRQFGVIADFMAAGQPLAVAALAAGVLPPVAEEAIREAPWFAGVLEASRQLQAMHQPEWLDRVRRMMRGVIERAVAEERVSLLHLAARQTEAMAPETFTAEDERRGVQALVHAMSTMTHAQLDEWQGLSRRFPPAGAAVPESAPAAASPADVSSADMSPAQPDVASTDAPPAGDPSFAPAPAIVPPPREPAREPWRFAAEATSEEDAPAIRPAPAGTIPMPRVVMAQLPRGRPIPGWLAPEPPLRPAVRPALRPP